MAKKLFFLVIISLLFTYGCIGSGSEDEKQIKELLYSNIESINNEDLSAYMESVHPEVDSESYNFTEKMMMEIFETYDMSCKIEKIDIIKIKEDEATVEVVQTCKKIIGPEYNVNKGTVIHKLKKYNGEWKFYESKLKSVEYLN